VAESPVREADPLAPAAGRKETALLQDARELAPVSLELEAVRLYAESGSLAAVSRALGIAIYELQKLQRTDWWQKELAALRREESAMKNAKLTKIHNLTLAALEDRLEHGDLIMRGSGFVRVKLSGRDLARISEAVFKQRQLLIGEPTHIDGVNKTLEKLSQKLRSLGAKDASHLTVDVEAHDVSSNAAQDSTSNTPVRAEPAFAGFDASGDD